MSRNAEIAPELHKYYKYFCNSCRNTVNSNYPKSWTLLLILRRSLYSYIIMYCSFVPAASGPWKLTPASWRLLPKVLMLFCHWYWESAGGGAGGLNVPTEPLQLGDRAAGLPAEGEVYKLRAKRECHSACALTPLALISSGRAAQIPRRELQWTWEVWFGPIKKGLCLPNLCVQVLWNNNFATCEVKRRERK